MKVICVKNEEYGPQLEIGKEYEVYRVDIYGFHTEVFIAGFDLPFNSMCFDDNFKACLHKAIDYFNRNYNDDNRTYGIFCRYF